MRRRTVPESRLWRAYGRRTKVGIQHLGPEVALSAPAGNCVPQTPGSPCCIRHTTFNQGTTTPDRMATDQVTNPNLRDELLAPLVSGIAL